VVDYYHEQAFKSEQLVNCWK